MAEPIVSQYSRESFQSARDSYVPESAQSAAGIISSNTSIIESGKPRIIVAIVTNPVTLFLRNSAFLVDKPAERDCHRQRDNQLGMHSYPCARVVCIDR